MTHARIDVGPYEVEGGWKDSVHVGKEEGGFVESLVLCCRQQGGREPTSFYGFFRLNDGERVLTLAGQARLLLQTDVGTTAL